ncbi:hypothetical protein HH219_00530 [Pseudoalteromonas sp. NEC-BIFX-2020_015]|uniref:hypothetical protein n=1 Tax=Pseudoalteromonas sp. NEC-BIFX-2020_015 TaxID=2729544 RepID=UPI00146131AF|nr:hypothetical protein [Pseudoalteromonas sp. NEC-BIFX-2020_015]NMR24044.1 hypothetical protein [Pseudoalteromonas sp. NEC-BIFX-2020_015]
MINKKGLFAAGAGIGGAVSAILANILGILDSPFSSWVLTGAIDAALIGAFLVYVQNYYQSNSWNNTNKVLNGASKGLGIGAAGGLLAFLSMGIFSDEIGRLVGWSISGAAAGYVASLKVPNLKVQVALIAGAIGGAIGLIVMNLGLSYTMGVVVTGAVIGLMVATSEEVFRKASINITLKPINAGISLVKPHNFNLTLGADPISVGFTDDMDINLTSEGITVQKQIGSITVEGDNVFFNSSIDNKKVEITHEKTFSVENCEIRLQAIT